MKLWVSDHAVERYIERVAPGLDELTAREQLRLLLEMAEVKPEPPEWTEGTDFRRSPAYAEVSDGIAVALEPSGNNRLIATTVLVRGGRDSKARAAHKARKRARKRRLREQRQAMDRTGHKSRVRARLREEPEPSDDF